MSIHVFIPARLGSTRLPGKPLKRLGDKPLIQWVYDGCVESTKAANIYITTDSGEIKRVAEAFGANVVVTSATHKSGTDRIAEACAIVGCSDDDVIVNVQGDEPMVTGELVDELIEAFLNFSDVEMVTFAYPSSDMNEFLNPNVVKVVMDNNYHALYFSRSPIPHNAADQVLGAGETLFWKHMGYYCYTYHFLKTFVSLPPGRLEQVERLEQLRALENGFSIGVKRAPFETIGVDTEEDLQAVSRILMEEL